MGTSRGKQLGLSMTADTDIVTALRAFGLNDVEIAVYTSALQLGSRPASVIAQKAGLKRAHTYNVLATLAEKGIIQEFVKNSVRHFTASAPTALLSTMEEREKQLEKQKSLLSSIIPELERLRSPLISRPRVRFFQGGEAVKQIYEDMLLVPNQIIYGVFDCRYSTAADAGIDFSWFQSYITRRAERNIWWHGIVVNSEVSDEVLQRRNRFKRKVKKLEGVEFPVILSIYGPKVAILSFQDETVGVLIDHQRTADALRNAHQMVWSFLPDYIFADGTPASSEDEPDFYADNQPLAANS